MKTERHLLLLVEMILNLLIFAVCAVVCVGLLLRAHQISRDSAVLTHAVYLAQSAAERFRAGEEPVQQEEGYTVELAPLAGGDAAAVTVWHGGKAIFTIEEVGREYR